MAESEANEVIPLYQLFKKITGHSFMSQFHGEFKIKIIYISNNSKSTSVSYNVKNENVGVLKGTLVTKFNVAREEQYLTFGGEELDDERKLSSYGVQNKSILQLMVKTINNNMPKHDNYNSDTKQLVYHNNTNTNTKNDSESESFHDQQTHSLHVMEETADEKKNMFDDPDKISSKAAISDTDKKDDKMTHILKYNHLYDDLYKILNDNEYDIDLLLEMEHSDINEFCEEFNLSQTQELQFIKLMKILETYDEVQYQHELMQETYDEEQRNINIIVIGDFGVGKTSLIRRYVEGYFDTDTLPTISQDTWTKKEKLSGDIIVNLKITDTAGLEKFDSIPVQCYREAECVMICFDLINPESFSNLANWTQKIETLNKTNPPMIIIGCKADSLVYNREAFEKKAQEVWKKYNTLYCECSSKTGNNVRSIFQFAAEKVMNKESSLLQLKKKMHSKRIPEERMERALRDHEDTQCGIGCCSPI
eukprot:147859_1